MTAPKLTPLTAEEVDRVIAKVPERPSRFPPIKRRYSVTADILSYRRCRRQYGFFKRRSYSPAQSGQLYFGTVIHLTLDKAHAHYRGELEGTNQGSFPTEADIARYFKQASDALHNQGIRRLSDDSMQKALDYVQAFNKNFGRSVYPRIIDTEHHLQKDKGQYILHGIVDVVAQTTPGSGWADYEIWDYKGAKVPKNNADGRRDLENYQFQMRVYAHLYQLRNGARPKRAVLWFLGEADPGKQQLEVVLDDPSVEQAVRVFEETVGRIEASIRADDWSQITRADAPAEETCSACDTRWNCPARTYRLRAL